MSQRGCFSHADLCRITITIAHKVLSLPLVLDLVLSVLSGVRSTKHSALRICATAVSVSVFFLVAVLVLSQRIIVGMLLQLAVKVAGQREREGPGEGSLRLRRLSS